MSDERLFFRKAKKRYNVILERSKEYLPKNSAVIENKAVVSDAKYLLNSGHFPACDQTSLNYFSSGSSFFEDVMESIKKAEKFIFIEFFIISDGLLFNRVSDLLKERAKEGVDVRIIYDDMGSHKTLSSKNKTMLKNAGIKVVAFNRLIPIFSLALNIRDHRKIIVIDGKTAYTGGCNLADEYVNEKRMYGYWKDSSIRLDGMAVDSFTVMFLRQWEFLTKKAQNYSAYVGQYEKVQASCAVIPYADGLDYQKNIAKGVYENMISSAQEKIMIMTPYFIVDDTIIELIINKITSGVEVSLIIPEIPDKKYAYGITRSNAEKLIDYGVKVFVMKNAFVHSKVVLTENAVVVGSINTDFRSFYQQFECAVYTDDSNFINLVEKDFEKTISVSSRITQRTKFRRSFLYRIYVGLMQLFAPFM
jgi:cardiolipin synthase